MLEPWGSSGTGLCRATGSLQQLLPRWGDALTALPKEAWELLFSSL